MFPGPTIRRGRREQVANPTERAPCPDPEPRRDDEPEDAPQELAVVDLPDTGHDERQHGSVSRSVHAGKGWAPGDRGASPPSPLFSRRGRIQEPRAVRAERGG